MKKNVRNILSAVLAAALLAVLLVIPAMAEGTVADTVTDANQLRTAVAKGGTVILGADIDIGDGAVEIDKTVVLDLNGKTLSCPGDTKGDGIFHVVAGGKLTINGDGTINSKGNNNYSMAVWADGGDVIINGGTYTNKGCKVDIDPDNNHYDLIYVKNGSSVSIHGGTFECEIPKWTLNSHDSLIGTFKVHGGTFMGFDPAAADTEPGGPVNWVVNGSACAAVGSVYNVTGVAAIGNAQYATLQAAIAAEAGDTITLLKDVVLEEILKIEKALTIVGAEKADGMYSITGNGKNSSGTYKTLEVYADLTLKNVEVINHKNYGRPVDMRNDGIILNVIDAKLTATSAGNNQLITVGGNGVGADGVAGKTVVNVSGSQLTAGKAGYGIIAFNPVEINITDASVSTGYNALYMKGISNSLGSAGSVINVTGSTLETFNNSEDVNSGAFGLFVTEDKNIAFNVDSTSSLTVEAQGAVKQFIIMNKAGGSSNVNIAPCTWTLRSATGNAMLIYDKSDLAGDVLLPNGDATKYQLRRCGYDYMEISEDQILVIVGHEHTNDPENDIFAHEVKEVAAEAPTCADAGWEAYEYCTVCDYTTKVEIPADGHDVVYKEFKDKTCTEDGYVEHYNCSVCGNNFADEIGSKELEEITIPAAHNFGDWVPKKAATCTEPGNEDHFLCSVCGLYKMLSSDGETYVDATEEEVIIPALGHKGTYVEFKDKDCTENGIREHWVCQVCSKVFGDEEMTKEWQPEDVIILAGHRYIPVEAKDATCAEDGNIEHYTCKCGAVFVYDGEGAKEVTLKDVTIAAKGHTMTKVETKTPTCTGDGNVEYYNCSACKKNFADEKGEKELSSVVEAAKGHKLIKVEAKAASCTAAGNVEHYSCDGCKKLFADAEAKTETTAEKVTVAAKGHTEVTVAAKAATCTETGLTEGKKCSVCGAATVEQKTVAALGHKLVKVDAKAATYTEAGNIEHYACACGKLFADAEGKKEITDVVIPQLIKVEEEKAEVSEGAVDNALADAKEKSEETGKPVEVVIEVPKAPVVEKPEGGETGTPEENPEQKPQEVVKVELPVQALENVAKEEANLTVVMPSVTVTVDTDALKAVTEQAAGNTVTLVVEQVKEETLTEKQQEAVKKYNVAVTIKAEFICQETNEKIWTEDNNTEKQAGSVTVKMPFTPAEGSEGSDYTVLYIADNGSVKEIKTSYEDGNLVFALEHFSEYVVVNTKITSVAPDTGVNPDTGDHVMLAPLALLLVLSVMGIAVMTAGKKNLI